MTTTASGNNLFQFGNMNMLPSMVVSGHEAVNIISRTVANLVWSKSALPTGNFTDHTPSLAPPALPWNVVRQFWQLPALYQSQFQLMAVGMLESVATICRAQQQLSALQGKSLSLRAQTIKQTSSQNIDELACIRKTGKSVSMAANRSAPSAEAA